MRPRQKQTLGLDRVKRTVLGVVREPAERPTPQAAFSELLRGRSVYNDHADLSGIGVARYSHASKVSLPECVGGCPSLRELLLPECERHFGITALSPCCEAQLNWMQVAPLRQSLTGTLY